MKKTKKGVKMTIKKGAKGSKKGIPKMGNTRTMASGKIKVFKKAEKKAVKVEVKGAKAGKKGKMPAGLLAWLQKKGGKKGAKKA